MGESRSFCLSSNMCTHILIHSLSEENSQFIEIRLGQVEEVNSEHLSVK